MLIDLLSQFKLEDRLKDDHFGEVIENDKDPDKLGAIKVKIEGLMEGAPDDLPWIYPEESKSMGGTLDSPSLWVPEVGNIVRVKFEYNNPYFGFYTGQRFTKNNTGLFDDDYPNTYGFQDSVGNSFLVNKKKGTIEISHYAGTVITIKDDGTVSITSEADTSIETTGDTKITTTGKADITSTGKTTLEGTAGVQVNGANLTIGNTPVPPTGLCSLAACLFTGAPHTTNTMLAQ